MWTSFALRLTPRLSARIDSVIDALQSGLHWYGTQMIKHGELLRESRGAPF